MANQMWANKGAGNDLKLYFKTCIYGNLRIIVTFFWNNFYITNYFENCNWGNVISVNLFSFKWKL